LSAQKRILSGRLGIQLIQGLNSGPIAAGQPTFNVFLILDKAFPSTLSVDAGGHIFGDIGFIFIGGLSFPIL
jgi:hypothetical protein